MIWCLLTLIFIHFCCSHFLTALSTIVVAAAHENSLQLRLEPRLIHHVVSPQAGPFVPLTILAKGSHVYRLPKFGHIIPWIQFEW